MKYLIVEFLLVVFICWARDLSQGLERALWSGLAIGLLIAVARAQGWRDASEKTA